MSGTARVIISSNCFVPSGLTSPPAPRKMDTRARRLYSGQHRKHQAKHHRHSRYRCHFTSHHARWVAPHTPLWMRQVWSGIPHVETGLILGSPGALLSLILFSPHKGVVWLFLATIAEVPPAVSSSRVFFTPSHLIPSLRSRYSFR